MHTRRLADPDGALERLEEPLGARGRAARPAPRAGPQVLEVRAPGMHKGARCATALEETDASGVVFAGDDLGDIEAFEAVAELRERRHAGAAGLLGAPTSRRRSRERADLVVDGPDGVLGLLAAFAADASTAAADRCLRLGWWARCAHAETAA